jgi:transposase
LSVGATVTQVAQRHEVTRQQIYAWRHNLKKKGLLSALLEALFLPVEFDRPMVLAMLAVATWAKAGHPAQIELQLGSGRCLRFDHALDRLTLRRDGYEERHRRTGRPCAGPSLPPFQACRKPPRTVSGPDV